MLSRRNIRIKVMQMLYTMSRDKKLKLDQGLVRYHENIRKSYELYLLNLLHLVRIAEYSEEVQKRKLTKLLPTEEDKAFTAKLSKNPVVDSIRNNTGFQALVQKFKLDERINEDATRAIYQEYAKTEEYKTYLATQHLTIQDHRKVLLAIYKLACGKEIFDEWMDDNFAVWTDDRSLVIGAIKKTVKILPVEGPFYEEHRPTGETTREFGETLLRKVCTEDKELLEVIEPTLKNWDADRVAIIDMILLKMALSELLSFPTIPTKVTLNEFVEISKLYSTDKSKDFINGILDRLMKKLNEEGRINKAGRGLKG